MDARCSRCGRLGHRASSCFAATHLRGWPLSTPRPRPKQAAAARRAGVYVLHDGAGGYYVGKSLDIDARVAQHRAAAAAGGRPADLVELPPETDGSADDLEAWERAETLHRMRKHGLRRVRGWRFTARVLPEEQRRAAFAEVCERFDLCRRCGAPSHFAARCPAGPSAVEDWAR